MLKFAFNRATGKPVKTAEPEIPKERVRAGTIPRRKSAPAPTRTNLDYHSIIHQTNTGTPGLAKRDENIAATTSTVRQAEICSSNTSSNVESFRKFLLANNQEQRQQKQQGSTCNGIYRRDSGYLTSGDQNSTISNTSSGLTTNSSKLGGVMLGKQQFPCQNGVKSIVVGSESVRSSMSSLEHASSLESGGSKENAKSQSSVDGDTTLVKCKSPIIPPAFTSQISRINSDNYGLNTNRQAIYNSPPKQLGKENNAPSSSLIKAPSESLLLDTETKSDTFRCQALCSEAMSLMVQAEKCQRLEDYSGAICFSTNAASRARQAMDHHQADPESITQARVIYNKCVTMGREFQAKLLSDRSSKHFPHRPNEIEGAQKFISQETKIREIKETQPASLYGTLPRASKLNKFKNDLNPKQSDNIQVITGHEKEVENKEIRRSEITLKFGRKESMTNTPPPPSTLASIQNFYKRRSEGIKEKTLVDNAGIQTRFVPIQTNQQHTKGENTENRIDMNMKKEKSNFRNLLSPKCPKSYHFLEELSRNLETEIDLMHQSLNQSTDSSTHSGGRISNSFNPIPKTCIHPPSSADQNGRPYVSYSPVPEKNFLKDVQIKTSENLASRKFKLLKHVNDSNTPRQQSSFIPNPVPSPLKEKISRDDSKNRFLSKSIPYITTFSPNLKKSLDFKASDTKIYERPSQTKIPTPPKTIVKDCQPRCQLCHKSQLMRPVGNMYCEDCTFYLGKFRRK